MVGLLRAELAQVKDANGVKSYGARNLDPRCRSSFYAIVHHADGPDERITSTGGRSGGALQELTSFVYGAALIYLLGGGLTSDPSYTTLFLDEALIKAEGIDATEEEIEAETKKVAEQYGMDLEMVKKYLPADQVKEQVVREKVIKLVADSATATAPVVETKNEEKKAEAEKTEEK